MAANATTFQKGQKRGPGRPPGTQNKVTVELKEMILQALDKAGGVQYLTEQATTNPGPFLTLVGKVLPMTVTGADGKAIKFEITAQWIDRALLERNQA